MTIHLLVTSHESHIHKYIYSITFQDCWGCQLIYENYPLTQKIMTQMTCYKRQNHTKWSLSEYKVTANQVPLI